MANAASRNWDSQFAAATAHHQAGRVAEARALYQRLRSLAPRDYRVLHLGGVALYQLNRPAEAVTWLEAALAVQPRAAASLMCLGLALDRTGRAAEAEQRLRAAVALEPKNGEAWTNLGLSLCARGRPEDGLAALRGGTEVGPKESGAWAALGGALLTIGQVTEALAAYDRAVALNPHDAAAHTGRAAALHAAHRMPEALAAFDAALRSDPLHLPAASQRLLVLHYLDGVASADLARAHSEFGQLAERLRPSRSLPPQGGPDKRLRVAFLSPDLRTHAVAFFIEPLLAGLPAAEFEVVLYHDYPSEDAMSARLRARASLWRNFSGQPDEVAGAAILADASDILVDLAGHTGRNRLGLLAGRVAPVQITYLGYPDTTGLRTMDFRFTDEVADPTNATDKWHTERLVRFAPTAWCYAPPPDAPEVEVPPMVADPLASPVFGSFNNLGKVSASTWLLWGRLLAAIPGARLLLKGTPPAPDWVARHAAAAGIEPGRITLLPSAPGIREHLACYSLMDVALDPVTYHGTTTTCEALWMGRPVVSLAGERHVNRVGASLLTAAGQGDCVAKTAEEFVAIACALVADRAALAARCGGLRAALVASPLCDRAGQGRAFSDALRACWQTQLG